MQKKSGYLNVKAMTRKDRVKIIGGLDFLIEPHIHEGCTFLGHGTGISQVYLPSAVAGRKFTFITSPDVNNGTYHQIELNPYNGIEGTDRIYDPDASAFMQPGFTIWNSEGAVSRKIVLECHNDGFWSVIQTIGTWEQPARSFTYLMTHPTGEHAGYIGMTGDPRLQVDLWVKNDKFVIAGATTIEDQVMANSDDLAAMTMENFAEEAGEVDIITANHIRFYMGGADELIGLDPLLLSDGRADITIVAGGMLSGTLVAVAEIRPLISGISGTIGAVGGSPINADGDIVITAHNDTWRADIATAGIWADMLTLTDDFDHEDVSITGVARDTDTQITITTAGNVTLDTGVGGINVNNLAFQGNIKTHEINQRLEGTVT